jgi:hypothetical protein
MPRIAIITPDKAAPMLPPTGYCGAAETRCYTGRDDDPIRLYLHTIAAGESFAIGPLASACAAYVWQGSVTAGATAMPAGSSIFIEVGAEQTVRAGSEGASVLTFNETIRGTALPEAAVHLMPQADVSRYAPEAGAGGVSGGLHANGEMPTCAVWLHENTLPGMSGENVPVMAERGIHSHSEDEVIFVTGGAIRLGAKLFPAGTAVAIAAGTFYSFTPGPDGVSFVNFRPGPPAAFNLKNGSSFDEAGYWRDRVLPPRYVN